MNNTQKLKENTHITKSMSNLHQKLEAWTRCIGRVSVLCFPRNTRRVAHVMSGSLRKKNTMTNGINLLLGWRWTPYWSTRP